MKSYDISALQKLELQHQLMLREHFFEFFDSHDYEKDTRLVTSQVVTNLSDLQNLYYGRGLYLIQTDYKVDENPCTHIVGELKTIYRGHCYSVKNRLISHLMNDDYRAALPEKGVRYDVCMKLDDKNGINITELPYKNYRWRVVIHKMPNSSRVMREQAELAFDKKFKRPLGSKEPTTSA